MLTRLEIENASIARIRVETAADIITVEFEGTVIIGDLDERSGRGSPNWHLDDLGAPADRRFAS